MRKVILVVWLCHIYIVGFAQFKLEGRILDSASLNPLESARIDLDTLSRIADEKGYFKFESLNHGLHTLIITHIGCEPRVLLIELLKDSFVLIYMAHHIHQFEPVNIVSGKRTAGNEPDLPRAEKVDFATISLNGARQLSDVLSQTPGLSFLKTGSAIEKPVIHGFQGNRIAIITQVGRLEGQQWGAEHAPEINPLLYGQIELVKGSASLAYGGDAVGGLIRLNPSPFDKRSYQRYHIISSLNFFGLNSRGLTFLYEKHRKDSSGFRTAFSYDIGSDMKAPAYVLSNTGFRQFGFSQYYIKYLASGELSLGVHFYSQTAGILSASHISNLSDLKLAFQSDTPLIIEPRTWKIGAPYMHVNHSLFNLRYHHEFNNTVSWNVAYQMQINRRSEFDDHAGEEELDIRLVTNTQQIYSFVTLRDKHRNTHQLGLNSEYQYFYFEGFYLIPNHYRFREGLYYILSKTRKKNEYGLGLRYDWQFQSSYRNRGLELEMKKFLFYTYSSNLYFKHHFNEDWTMNISASSLYKFPDMNELLGEGLHHSSAIIEEGNPNLKPERSHNFHLGFLYHHNRILIDFEPFMHYFKNYIGLLPSGESRLTIRGAFPVFRYFQTNAFMSGADLSIKYQIMRHTLVEANASALYAKDLLTALFLYGIPSNRFTISLKQKFRDLKLLQGSNISLNSSFVSRQSQSPQEYDFSTTPSAYFLLNLSTATELVKIPLHFQLSLNNLLNSTYRDYLSRYRYFADEPGIHLRLNISLKIE